MGRVVADGGRLPRRHQNSAYRLGDLSAAGMQWCRPSVALFARGRGMIVADWWWTVVPRVASLRQSKI